MKPKKCERCNRKEHRLFFDHELKKWICSICWKKTHNINTVKSNWNALGINH